MRSCLVTGATGFVGSHLVRGLLQRGWAVRAVARDPARAGELARAGAAVVRGDLDDPASLRGVGDGVEVVLHAAAQLNLPGVSAEQYRRANVEGTRRLVEAVRGAGLKRFVQVSSIAAIGIRATGMIDESYPCRPDIDYGKSKLAVDRYLEELARREGFPAVVVRPPTVYGPGERYNFLSLCRAIASNRFLLVGRGDNRVDFCWVGNLVQVLIAAAERGRPGETYLVADQPTLAFRETTQILSQLLRGQALPPFHLPLPVAHAVALPLAVLGAVLRRPMPLTPKRVRTMSSDQCFDVSKARRDLGYAPEGTFREQARRTIDWYRAQGLI
jgi:nucleoside-diphosphate-sugar epimerase